MSILKAHIAIASIILLLTTGCDNNVPESSVLPQGSLKLSNLHIIGCDVEAVPMSRAQDVNSMIVTILDADGNADFTSSFGALPETLPLEVGDYTIKVRSYGEDDEPLAAMNSGCYEGSEQFSIRADKITEVYEIVCSLVSLKVDVRFDESLLNLLGNDVKVEVKTAAGGELTFTARNTSDIGYFKIVENTVNSVTARLTGTIDGNEINETCSYSDVKSGEYYRFTFKAKEQASGTDVLPYAIAVECVTTKTVEE